MKGNGASSGSGGNGPSVNSGGMGPKEKFSLFGGYRLQWGARR